ncbi:hypothetical protein CB0940_06502 [Cercospora beticola]|uniref:RING-type domain-containing protein n=1 Tax=Cercospora beticola TaxID=122368 RepID=A0A2G5I0X2_CERBT|nr:hypothetical protein CB0940_06502 [Cercospora beticola]PIA98436.1 hypothetical protein CB0940_06502 [Cercospora beticola]WPA99140.1 hypothetical protein RHO25_003756 [Cercospora beticola]
MSQPDQAYEFGGPMSEAELQYECVGCGDTMRPPSAASIHGLEFCQQCFNAGIRPLFEQYLANELAPVVWQGRAISFNVVRHQFSAEFVSAFRERVREYAVLPRNRIYCAGKIQGIPCEKFLGDKRRWRNEAFCLECKSETCTSCAAIIDLGELEHKCAIQLDPLADLVRGADYQLCPKCGLKVELAEACNHMQCQLAACGGTSFCYTCGEEVVARDGHWSAGRLCPRYNLPNPLKPMTRDRLAEESYIREHAMVRPARDELHRVRKNLVLSRQVLSEDRLGLLHHPDAQEAQRALIKAMRPFLMAFDRLEGRILEHGPVVKKRAALAPAIREAYLSGIAKDDRASLLQYPAIASGYADLERTIAAAPRDEIFAELVRQLQQE